MCQIPVKVGQTQEPLEIVGVGLDGQLSVGELVPSHPAGDARLDGALDRVSDEIVGARVVAIPQEQAGLTSAQAREVLEVSAVHPLPSS